MNSIIIYYSYQNNTRKLANYIKEALNCQILELVPVVPYSDNYDDVVALGENEETKNVRPELQTNIPNLDSYDTVILCTPTWWDNIAPVMISFLEKYPLTNKDIYVLATNGGFGLGKGKECLEELCGKESIHSVLEVPFDEDEMEISMDVVNAWIESIKK